VLVGLLLATLTSVGLAFVSEYLDPTFRTPDEVRSFLNIPVLATMPQNGKNGVATHVS
jgi:capsular polysaccharide biosynthesis protein